MTHAEEADLHIDSIDQEIDLEMTITRAEFENLCKPIFDKFDPLLTQALEEAHYDKSEIDEIILVGGSTRIPKV